MSNLHNEALTRGEKLPDYYGEDCLIALPRDPYYLFSYWEISNSTLQRLQQEWGDRWNNAFMKLRVYMHRWQQEDEIDSFFDIPLKPDTSNWYQSVSESDRVYHVEIGWQMAEGEFKSVMQSNPVRLARDGLSDIIDEDWQLPDWKTRKLYRRISLHHLSSPELLRRRQQRP